jgi:DNA-binding NarL/FixJ family response regulator
LREGLRAALNALHGLETVGLADTAAHVLDMVREPTFVLLSTGGRENSNLAAIQKIKVRWPAVRCVVLVDTVAQQQAAKAAGAEEALIKGILPADLLGRIEDLLAGGGPAASEGDPPDW